MKENKVSGNERDMKVKTKQERWEKGELENVKTAEVLHKRSLDSLCFGVTKNSEIFCESKGDGSQSELHQGKEENVRTWRRHSREDLRRKKKKNKEKGRFLKNMWIQGTISCFDFCLIFMIGNNRAVFLTFDHLSETAGDFSYAHAFSESNPGAMTKYPSLGGLHNRYLISYSSRGWAVQDQGLVLLMPAERSLLGLHTGCLGPHMTERGLWCLLFS